MRLNRFLARAGSASRRGADALIESGRVRVNGRIVRTLGTTIDPENDLVELDGESVVLPEAFTYIAINKPVGFVVTMSDPQGRPTVAELMSGVPAGVVPVGRLDFDSEGLIIATDDGDLAHRIAHPSFELDKVYEVDASGVLSEEQRRKLESGVDLDGRVTSPAVVRVTSTTGNTTTATVVIHEGRKRQVRRMFEFVGHPVTRLKRVRVGSLELGDLEPGQWRHLEREELRKLREALNLPDDRPRAQRGRADAGDRT